MDLTWISPKDVRRLLCDRSQDRSDTATYSLHELAMASCQVGVTYQSKLVKGAGGNVASFNLSSG